MAGEGMVAVVQGLRQCGVAVTVLDDDGKSYTLVPSEAAPAQIAQNDAGSQSQAKDGRFHNVYQCDAGAQVTDGRFATVYQVQHCKVEPTNPPALFTEFPPQRPEVCRGHGNFDVGGTGSGETGFVPVRANCFRGGLSWADRGCVCSPRPSRDPDAFARSLRKYPPSPERSPELLERLITYSQAKNYRSPHHSYSPSRNFDNLSNNSVLMDRGSRSPRQAMYECDRRQGAPEDCPTRDRKQAYYKNNDVRFVRDISKRLKESIKSMSSYPYTQPACPDMRDRYEAPTSEMCNANSVNMQIQAGADMVSRKVSTVPIPVPVRRTVAVPLSPASSDSTPLPVQTQLQINHTTRSVQTIQQAPARKSVQTTTSSIDITNNKVRVTRKSKSFSDFSIDEELKGEILGWLDDNSDPKVKQLRDAVLKKLSKRYKQISLSNSKREKVKAGCSKRYDKGDEVIKERIINELHRTLNCSNINDTNDMLKVKGKPFKIATEQRNFENAIEEWINDICLKKGDFLRRPVDKDQIYNTVVNRLKHLTVRKSASYREQLLRAEILDVLDEVSIEFHGISKRVYLNTLADALITKLNKVSVEHKESNEVSDWSGLNVSRYCSQSENELKVLVADTMIEFMNKIKAKIKPDCLKEIEMDLMDILLDSINAVRKCEANFVQEEIVTLLKNVTKLPEKEAAEFATQLTGQMKEIFNDKKQFTNVAKPRHETVFMFRDTPRKKWNDTININITDQINLDIHDKEDDAEVIQYMNQLSEQIDEWLSSLKIAQAYDKEFRREAVNDLASDIVDRCKYLELNNRQRSNTDELEHLKYQIFKWINKLVGEDNTETIDNADELMERIKRIPVPMMGGSQDQITKCKDVCDRRELQNANRNAQIVLTVTNNLKHQTSGQGLNNSNEPGPSGYTTYKPDASNSKAAADSSKPLMSSLRPPCCSGPQAPGTPSMKQLNEEYDNFLTNWVQEIPIQANNETEAAIAEKARIGIHHGVWKVIAKIKFEPAMFHNKFFYEDVLEEAIDELLDLLPQTQELKNMRHEHKVKLIERTNDINELLKAVSSPASYKQELAQQVAGNLPRTTVKTDEEDPKQLYEEMLIQLITEDFILSTKYKDEDKLKSNAYRNKVVRKIEEYLNNAKRIHGKDITELNKELCINDVISALHKVPLPSEETLKEEADEILLGIEIDQWFSDLPVVRNDDEMEQIHRRRLRDALVKKLHEMEKEINITDCIGEPQFNHEISVFLDKIPLEKDQDLNINFMVEELTNRIKNRERIGGKKKSVAFRDGQSENGQNLYDQTNISAYNNCCQESNQGQLEMQDQSRFAQQQNSNNRPAVHFNDTDYHNFSMERPACSSMIDQHANQPQAYTEIADCKKWGLDSQQSQKWYSFDSAGNPKESSAHCCEKNFSFAPGQYQEEHLAGRFGDTLQGQFNESNQRPFYDPNDSANATRQGPPIGSFFDSQGCLLPSTAVRQNQLNPPMAPMYDQGRMQQSCVRAPQNMNSDIGGSAFGGKAPPQTCQGMAQNISAAAPYDRSMDMSSFRRFSGQRPPCSSWNEASGEFVSLLCDGPAPNNYVPPPRAPSTDRTHFESYQLPNEVTQGGRFALGDTQSKRPFCSGQNSQRAVNPPRFDQQGTPQFHEEGLVKTCSGIQNQSRQTQPWPSLDIGPGKNTSYAANASQGKCPREVELASEFSESADREGIHEVIERNRSANACQWNRPAAQDASRNASMPQAFPKRGFQPMNEAPNRSVPSACANRSCPDQDQRFVAPNNAPQNASMPQVCPNRTGFQPMNEAPNRSVPSACGNRSCPGQDQRYVASNNGPQNANMPQVCPNRTSFQPMNEEPNRSVPSACGNRSCPGQDQRYVASNNGSQNASMPQVSPNRTSFQPMNEEPNRSVPSACGNRSCPGQDQRYVASNNGPQNASMPQVSPNRTSFQPMNEAPNRSVPSACGNRSCPGQDQRYVASNNGPQNASMPQVSPNRTSFQPMNEAPNRSDLSACANRSCPGQDQRFVAPNNGPQNASMPQVRPNRTSFQPMNEAPNRSDLSACANRSCPDQNQRFVAPNNGPQNASMPQIYSKRTSFQPMNEAPDISVPSVCANRSCPDQDQRYVAPNNGPQNASLPQVCPNRTGFQPINEAPDRSVPSACSNRSCPGQDQRFVAPNNGPQNVSMPQVSPNKTGFQPMNEAPDSSVSSACGNRSCPGQDQRFVAPNNAPQNASMPQVSPNRTGFQPMNEAPDGSVPSVCANRSCPYQDQRLVAPNNAPQNASMSQVSPNGTGFEPLNEAPDGSIPSVCANRSCPYQDQSFVAPNNGPQNASMPQVCPNRTGFQPMNEAPDRSVPSACANRSCPGQDSNFLAPNPPQAGMSISNQPVGFSTPNQRTSNACPPNIKEVKRQIDRDRNSDKDSGTDSEGEEVRIRCQCMERVRRCKRMRAPCFDFDNCMEGAFPFYFPMRCPHRSYPRFCDSRK